MKKENILKVKLNEYKQDPQVIDNLASEFYGKVLTQGEEELEIEFDTVENQEKFKKTLDGCYGM